MNGVWKHLTTRSAGALLPLVLGCTSASPEARVASSQPGRGAAANPIASTGPVQPSDAPAGVFLLDGEPLCFAGANNYYLMYKPRPAVDDVLDTAKAMGIRVLRHWAFMDRGSMDGRVPSIHDGTDQFYFQYWDARRNVPAYNDGPSGLEKLDYLLYAARRNDLRVVLVFTNNWRDFGGMDQYLTWYDRKRHHEFYSDERIKGAFKDYIRHLVERVNTYTGVAYKDDPYIFGWELANEPRRRNFEDFDGSEGWRPALITSWAQEMSDYVRSLDPHHLISVGDEGFYMNGREPLYDGADGVDHDALVALSNVDYTTFHLYPDHWGQPPRWGERWIEDHLESARRVGKPAVLEEYNLAVRRDEITLEIVAGGERRDRALRRWHELLLKRGAAGAMFWMLAGYDEQTRSYYKDYDHFTVYSPRVDVTGRLMAQFAFQMNEDARACQLARQTEPLLRPKRDVPAGFVTTSDPDAVRRAQRARRAQ